MNICVHRLWHYREVILNKYTTTLQNNTMQTQMLTTARLSAECLSSSDAAFSFPDHYWAATLDLKYSNPANKTYIKE